MRFSSKGFFFSKTRTVFFLAVLVASCASINIGSSQRLPADLDCVITPESATQLSQFACQSAAAAGMALCTPSGPLGMGGMVCQSVANGVTMPEMPIDPTSMAENGTATQTISAPLVMPNGEVAAVAACAINRRHNSVVYAVLTRGPLNKQQAEYLRNQGSCSN